jgi:preprotein translocase subunit YajC
MLVIIVISAIICFLILTPERQKKKTPDFFKETVNATNTISGGISEIVELGTKANDIYKLKKQVEQIISKDKLTKADSVFLEKAILVLDSNSKLIRQKP